MVPGALGTIPQPNHVAIDPGEPAARLDREVAGHGGAQDSRVSALDSAAASVVACARASQARRARGRR